MSCYFKKSIVQFFLPKLLYTTIGMFFLGKPIFECNSQHCFISLFMVSVNSRWQDQEKKCTIY